MKKINTFLNKLFKYKSSDQRMKEITEDFEKKRAEMSEEDFELYLETEMARMEGTTDQLQKQLIALTTFMAVIITAFAVGSFTQGEWKVGTWQAITVLWIALLRRVFVQTAKFDKQHEDQMRKMRKSMKEAFDIMEDQQKRLIALAVKAAVKPRKYHD